MKNVKAKFSNKTKEAIYERDLGVCFSCWANSNLQFHHIYYGMQKILDKTRNNVEMGITVCFSDHLAIHSCKSWTWIREEAINYIKNYYEI